ncbi:MAG: L-threonylcarbamoyladenylate synthase [Anaerolineae bacterium]|nr:L-threonylcarbamoyladenylate synthase [Anaerolineae bacterium]MDW8173525.1 L-threonylcarbamoyladenylate synthase [Anaerolineae bacterium]
MPYLTPTYLIHLNLPDMLPEALALAGQIIREGGLVAFPTETVYGLGANALDEQALARIFAAKERPTSDPIIAHVAYLEQVAELAQDIPPEAEALARVFWPGPLTLVLRKRLHVPDLLTAGQPTVAVRLPDHPIARAFIEAAERPIAAPSANRFSRPSPTRAEHVLYDLSGRVDVILDGGPTPIGLESTIVDFSQPDEPPRLLRLGGLPLEALRAHLPTLSLPVLRLNADQPAPAPGTLLKHYAPTAEVVLFRGQDEAALRRALRSAAEARLAQGQRLAALLPDGWVNWLTGLPIQVMAWGEDSAQRSARLFAALRELEQQPIDAILACAPPQVAHDGLDMAAWDRLLRAAEGRFHDV